MGYRSNGKWIIKGPVADVRAAWIKCQFMLTPPAGFQTIWDEFKLFRVGDEGFIRFEFEGFKWYTNSDYKGINFYESVWALLAGYNESKDKDIGNTTELSGKRIRIGDDDGDVHAEDFGDDPPDISTYVLIQDDDEPRSGEPITSNPTATHEETT